MVASEEIDVPAVAQLYKNDLDSIRATVTCSVCDQLLYEPWTLGCGHTYCYSVRSLLRASKVCLLTLYSVYVAGSLTINQKRRVPIVEPQ